MSASVTIQEINTSATQEPIKFPGGPAILSLTGDYGGTSATFEIDAVEGSPTSDHWSAIEDLDGPVTLTENGNVSLQPLPRCSIRCITTGGSSINLKFAVRTGRY